MAVVVHYLQIQVVQVAQVVVKVVEVDHLLATHQLLQTDLVVAVVLVFNQDNLEHLVHMDTDFQVDIMVQMLHKLVQVAVVPVLLEVLGDDQRPIKLVQVVQVEHPVSQDHL